MWTRTRLRLASLFRRRRFDQEVADELAFHVEVRAEDLRRAGVDAGEAVRRARIEFGSAGKFRDEVRDVRAGAWVEQLGQDLRYGVRVLAGRPGFTAAAVVTLALGIGATSTVFSLLDIVLLRPLPVRNPHELAHVYTSCRAGDVYCAHSYPEFLDYRVQSRAFADMAAFAPTTVNVSAGGGAWIGDALLVTTNYFTLLGVAPLAGQLFRPEWDATADPAVVLAYGTWVDRFGRDPAAIGRTIRLSGSAFRIIGVAPSGFHGTRLDIRPDLWLAIENVGQLPVGVEGPDRLTSRGTRWVSGTVGRLRTGVTVAQAQTDMTLISDGFQATDPTRQGRFVTVEPAGTAALPPTAAGDIRQFVLLLMGGVGATLFIACANIAGLLLARGAARRQELDVRRALGANRGRLVRQLLTEYVLLAAAGTSVGLLVARWAMAVLGAYDLPGGVSIASLGLGLDPRVLGFAIALLAITGLVGLLPALGATRGMRAAAQGRTTSEGASGVRGQGVLLSVQVAVTVVLLFAAGLFVRSLQGGLALDLGLTREPLVMAAVAPTLERYTPDRTRAVLDEAAARLSAMPGVSAVSPTRVPPLALGAIGFMAQSFDGYSPAAGEELRIEANFVGPDYFRATGITLTAGRPFDDRDREGTPLVAIVSETIARRYWAGRDPVGGRFTSASLGGVVEVVGVAQDISHGLDGPPRPLVYAPFDQHPRFATSATLLVRARDSAPALSAVRGVLQQADPSLPVTEIRLLGDRIDELLMPQRMGRTLLSALAGLTVLLVSVGVIGMVGYGVSRRRKEIGIRLALGARRGQVAAAMTRGAVVPVAIGLAMGVGAAVLLGRLASGFLYGIEPTDPLTVAASAVVLACVAAVAAGVPAYRASGISPVEVLSAE